MADHLRRPILLCAAFAWAPCACRGEPAPPIHVAIGDRPTDRTTFVPKAAFAKYFELPGSRNELRLTIASHEASCDHFVPLGPRDAMVTVVVVTPPGTPPGAGRYAWNGRRSAQEGQVHAVVSARLGKRSHQFAPGGSIQLERVELRDRGVIGGLLDFEFSGDAERPASSVRGRFAAALCKLETTGS